MKKKIFMLLALVCMTLTASASAGYELTAVASDYGQIAFTVDGSARTYADEGETVTVTITPNTGYVVNQPSGQWIAAIAASRGQAPSIDLLKDVTLTPVTGQDNQWTFEMKRANVEISSTYKKLLTNTDITIQDITALTYTGEGQEPTVTVKDGTTELVKDVDYTVTYSNNTDAALSTAENAPTVTITAVATSEDYAGETTKTFTIQPKALEDAFIAAIADQTFTGDPLEPALDIIYNEMKLEKDKDYTVEFKDNVVTGTAGVTVTGQGNYSGTAAAQFTVIAASGTVVFSPYEENDDYGNPTYEYKKTYGDENFTVTPFVIGDGTLTYSSDNETVATVDAETGEVTINGAGKAKITATLSAGANYTGDKDWYWVVVAKAAGSISYETASVAKVYGDEAFTNELTLEGDGTVSYSSSNTDVATVDPETGLVTIVDAGEAIITATVTDGDNYQYAEPTAQYTLVVVADKEVLDTAVDDADDYYSSIKDDYADIAAALLNAINAAKAVKADNAATLAAVAAAVANLNNAVQDAKNAVAAAVLAAAKEELLATIQAATDYSNSIKDDYADIAAALNEVISAAQGVYDAATSTDGDCAEAVAKLNEAVQNAKDEVMAITTGIGKVSTNTGANVWYDMNGRRLSAKPTVKGVYILNGRKVVIK